MINRNTKKGFLVTGNGVVAGVFFLLVGVFGFNFFAEDQAATTFSLESSGTVFSVGDTVAVDVYIITRIPFNAVDAIIHYPNENIEVKEIIYDKSVVDVWVTEPTFSNEEGVIRFMGGTTRKGGVVGKSPVATVMFTPVSAGDVSIDFEHSVVLANDGVGSNLDEALVDADFIIHSLENSNQENIVKKEESTTYVINNESEVTTDLNNDGETSLRDLSVFLSGFRGDYTNSRDFNQDGEVNLKDVSIIMSKIIK